MIDYSNPLQVNKNPKYLLLILVLFLELLLSGCTIGNVEQASESQQLTPQPPTIIRTTTPLTVTTSAVTKEPTLSISTRVISTPIATLETPLPVASTATIIAPVTTIQERCSTSDPELVNETEAARGLILRGTWDEGVGAVILGQNSFDDPLIFMPDQEGQIVWPQESLDKVWLADLNSNRPNQTEEIVVWNPFSGEEIRQTFEGIIPLAYDAVLRWTKDYQLVLPLENEDEFFQWLVWSPFTGEQETLSTELSGIGNNMELFKVPPSLDPLLELVAYPCEFCDEAEYVIKNIETSETVWTIDLGPRPSYAYRGPVIWSPDGEFAAIVGGRNSLLNDLWIYNRQGEIVYEIVLPDIGGIVAASLLKWSPDSKYLAFSRGGYNDEGEKSTTLNYVSLLDGSVTDLCIDSHTQSYWSPDNTKIAFSQQIQSGEQPQLISIVNINSGSVIQLRDDNAQILLGWIALPDN